MTPAPDAHAPTPRGDPARPARPERGQIRRWRKYLAEERAEARIYSLLAARSTGREQEILHQVAEAEQRHAEHWVRLLGPHAEAEARPSLYSRLLIFLATHFGSVFVLALIQRAESRSPYDREEDASDAMAADTRRGHETRCTTSNPASAIWEEERAERVSGTMTRQSKPCASSSSRMPPHHLSWESKAATSRAERGQAGG